MKTSSKRWVLFLTILALAVLIEEASFRLRPPAVYSQGPNAIWLRHSWIGDAHTDTEYRTLARLLTEAQITDAYFHAGPLTKEGRVAPERLRHARDLVKSMHAHAPGIRVQAWLGQVEAAGGGPLALSSAEVRKEILQTSKSLLDMGYDGIHIDIEPVRSGNRDFIALMHSLHALTRSRGAVLSVAACDPEPLPGLESAVGHFAKNPGLWSKAYYLDVAREVDQVAVMTYDSGIPLPSLYGRSIAWIVDWSAAHGVKDLIIGIPTYDNLMAAHYPYVENPENALIGLRHGVGALAPNDRKRVGAGIYAEWTTTPSDWRTYNRLWLDR